jgi:hypothetical protein
MAYMQKPGRAPLKNKSFEALTNGTPLRNDHDKEKKTGETKKVKSYNVKTGKESTKTVKANSPDAELSQRLGGTLEFESADQNPNNLTPAVLPEGTNRNIYATRSTFGTLPANFRGRARDTNNNPVDFSNNNNDSRRKEKFMLYK